MRRLIYALIVATLLLPFIAAAADAPKIGDSLSRIIHEQIKTSTACSRDGSDVVHTIHGVLTLGFQWRQSRCDHGHPAERDQSHRASAFNE